MNIRQPLLEKLGQYSLRFPEEHATINKIVQFVKHNEHCFERTNLEGHITGSAFITYKNNRILLMHHKKLDIWVQPGGHSDGDPNTLNVALREGEEETGLQDLYAVSDDIFDIDIHQIPERKQEPAHLHYDIRFLLKTDHPESIIINHESNQLRWFDDATFEALKLPESVTRMKRKITHGVTRRPAPTTQAI
jgi:8-oxo-dGTP pyrophosphatase MutT (NUDIX family)